MHIALEGTHIALEGTLLFTCYIYVVVANVLQSLWAVVCSLYKPVVIPYTPTATYNDFNGQLHNDSNVCTLATV